MRTRRMKIANHWGTNNIKNLTLVLLTLTCIYVLRNLHLSTLIEMTFPDRIKLLSHRVWQEFDFFNQTSKVHHTFYINQLYYDNRAKHRGKHKIVGFISGPALNYTDIGLRCLLWTKGAKDYKSTLSKTSLAPAVVTQFTYHGVRYDPYYISCDVLGSNSPPEFVTIIDSQPLQEPNISIRNVTNLVNVTVPERPNTPTNVTKKIGICTHGMHGEVKDDEIPLLVQWFELSQMFGASEITLYNVSLTKWTKYFENMIEHYTKKGLLKFVQFPGIPPSQKYIHEYDPMHARQIVIRHALGDCIYRNLHTYWYNFHIDTDEIAVPRTCKTYAECISTYLKTHQNRGSQAGLSVKRNYQYYKYTKFEIPTISKNYPALRYVMRDNNELAYLGKSFLNPRQCDYAWEHRCFKVNTIIDIDPKDILVHHYRSSCEVALKRMCSRPNPDRVRDTFLLDNYKDIVIKRTDEALKAISWTKDM